MKVISNIIKILASLGGLFILIGGVLMAVTFPYGENFDTIISSEYKTVIDREEEFDLNKVNTITVKGNMDVTIINGVKDNKIGATASGTIINRKAEQSDLIMNLNSNGELEFSLKYRLNFSAGFYGMNINRVLLEIMLPSSYSGKLNLENASKDISVNVTNKFSEVNVDSASGNVSLSNLSSDVLDADITSGKLELNGLNVSDFDLYLTSGNIELNNIAASKSTISITSGSVKGTRLYAKDSAYFKTTSGNIEITDLTSEKITTKLSSGKMKFFNVDTKNFETDVTSGKIEIDLKNVTNIAAKLTSGNFNVTGPAPTNYNCAISISSGSVYNNDFLANQANKISNSTTLQSESQIDSVIYKFSLTSGKITLNAK